MRWMYPSSAAFTVCASRAEAEGRAGSARAGMPIVASASAAGIVASTTLVARRCSRAWLLPPYVVLNH